MSGQRLALTAATKASGKPSTIAITSDMPVSNKVTGNRSVISRSTGTWNAVDIPKSPCEMATR